MCVSVCICGQSEERPLSLVSVMVGALPGEVVYSLGQVKWVELRKASEAIFEQNDLSLKTYT